MMPKRMVWLVVSVVVAFSAPALAEQGGRETARRHYTEGQALFNAGNYQAALAEFRMANDIAPHPITIKSQAECLERLGRIREAVDFFEQYLRELPTAADASEVRARIAAHRTRPGRLQVVSNPPGAQVTIDGRLVGGATPLTVDVTSGRHAVSVQLQGYQMANDTFDMPFGGQHTVNLNLQPGGGQQVSQPSSYLGPPPTEPVRTGYRLTTPVWIMIGLTAAGLATGIVTGALALADQGDFDDRVAGEGVTSANRLELEDLGDGGTTKALIADISFGITAAAAITGIVLFFVQNRGRAAAGQPTASRRQAPRFSIAPGLALDGGGLSAVGTF